MSTFVINPSAEQEELVAAFLEEQHIPFSKENDTPPDFVLEGIAKSREDYEAGRFFSFDEFKAQFKTAG